MLVLCSECNQQAEAKLRIKKDADGKVVSEVPVCMNCKEIITKISPFALQAMKSTRDFMEDKKESFAFMCNKCQERRPGLVTRDGKKVVCSKCGAEIIVAPFMRLTLKNLGKFVED